MGSSPKGESQLSPFGRRDNPSSARQYTNDRVKACNPQHWQSGNLKRSIRCIAKQWSSCFEMVKRQSDLEGQCAGNGWKNYITHSHGNINHPNAWCRSCKARSILKKLNPKSLIKHIISQKFAQALARKHDPYKLLNTLWKQQPLN